MWYLWSFIEWLLHTWDGRERTPAEVKPILCQTAQQQQPGINGEQMVVVSIVFMLIYIALLLNFLRLVRSVNVDLRQFVGVPYLGPDDEIILGDTEQDLTVNTNSSDVIQLSNSSDVIQLSDSSDVIQLSNSSNVIQLSNNRDVIQLSNSSDVIQLSNSSNVIQLSNSSDVIQLSNSSDVIQLSNQAILHPPEESDLHNVSSQTEEFEDCESLADFPKTLRDSRDSSGSKDSQDSRDTWSLSTLLRETSCVSACYICGWSGSGTESIQIACCNSCAYRARSLKNTFEPPEYTARDDLGWGRARKRLKLAGTRGRRMLDPRASRRNWLLTLRKRAK